MVDSRITGATIARLRRSQDWTQLELAERLHVTPQAVSRWETGDSFPDIGQLARLSEIFKVSIDALLTDGVSRSAQPGHATTGEVLVELSQGNAQEVARKIVANQADLESVIEAAPLTRPSIIEKVIQNMNGYSFTQEQISDLAPFVDRELLVTLVEGLDAESLQPNMLVELAPFLDADSLDRLIAQFGDLPVSADMLEELAPFLKRESLSALVDRLNMETLQAHHVIALAPFLPSPVLYHLIDQLGPGALTPEMIVDLAPFLDRASLSDLIRVNRE